MRTAFLAILLSLLGWPGFAVAAELDTERYTIDVQTHCPEGDVACDQITCTATDKTSGRSVTLEGWTWHLPCADGVTPCRFLGYRFADGDTTWRLHADGLVEGIGNDGKTVFREQGRWAH